MATLSGKIVLIVGGTSGIGFSVAKASLLSLASRVIVASSNPAKVSNAVERLQVVLNEAKVAGKALPGTVNGEVVDAKSGDSIRSLMDRVGEIDHLVWTSGDSIPIGADSTDPEKHKNMLDVRFWGAVIAAQRAKIRKGGSITLTTGVIVVKPIRGWGLGAGTAGAVDSVARGLAVDLAPIRVNAISPGLVLTEMLETLPKELLEKMKKDAEETLLVKHVGDPDDIAEAYLFVMKCQFVTGQRIEVDGGFKLV